ncbi:zinc finger protein, partial [Oryctes borbonicus]
YAGNISAVFTFKWKGEEMARYLENNTEVFVEVTVGRQEPIRNAALNRTSVLFVSITFIVLMIISLAWLVFYYIQRLRNIHAKDKLSRKLCNAAKKALSKIPTKTIKSEDKEVKDGECCAVCIEPYKPLEVLRILPCTHEFHKNCIDPWLLEHRTCPMCKMDILKHYGFMVSDKNGRIYDY